MDERDFNPNGGVRQGPGGDVMMPKVSESEGSFDVRKGLVMAKKWTADWMKTLVVEDILRYLSLNLDGNFEKFATWLLLRWNVEGDYTVASHHPEHLGPDTVEAFREKIKSGPLLVFGNHPGLLDQGLVYDLVRRRDVLIMVNQDNYDLYAKIDPDHFIVASQDSFPQCINHIKNGGSLIIFPGQPTERRSVNPYVSFQKGITYIMGELPANCNIVTTLIDRSYTDEHINRIHKMLLYSLGILGDVGQPAYKIKVQARLSNKEPWMEAMEKKVKAKDEAEGTENRISEAGVKAEAMSEFYMNQFGLNTDFTEKSK